MKFRLSAEIRQTIPGFSAAVLVIKNINNVKKSSNVNQLLAGACAAKKRELSNESKRQKMFGFLKQTHFDHKILKETQSLESLLNKVAKSKDLSYKNNLTGLLYFLSLKYLVPLYGYDLDQVEKDIELDFIVPKPGKKAQDIEFTPDTKNIVVWFIDVGSQTKEQFAALPDEVAKIIKKYCGGEAEVAYMLNADLPEVDLNYTSEKEKEYKWEQERIEQEKALTEKILATDEPPFLETPPPNHSQDQLPQKTIKELLEEELSTVVKNLEDVKKREDKEEICKLKLETPHESTHGDYASSIALKLGKILQKNPQEIAGLIKNSFPSLSYIDRIEIAGPGFINFHISTGHLQKELEKILQRKSNFGRLVIGKDKTVIIEYSSPNIAKPLGVHHVLSTVIGQTIADIYRFCGYKVISANYLGDWGTQYGKMIYAYKTWGNRETVEKNPLNELLKLYVHFHSEAEKEPTLEDKAREEFKKLEEGDEGNRKLLDWMREVSVKELERLYKILGVHFDEYLPESRYPKMGQQLIEEGWQKGILVEGEKGALIVRFENDKYPPYILRKSDGTTIYGTRDLASIKDRLERYHPDELIYVVDVAQSLHFQQLFETAQKFGFTGAKFTHVVFGRMQMPEGKMSTRKGDIILLDEVIKEAVSRTQKLIEEKSKDLTPEEKQQVAQGMAVSAIKYNIISQNRETNITFDWDRMLSLEGNSGPYLQYACARAQSILRKARESLKNETASNIHSKSVTQNEEGLQTSLFSMVEKKVEAETSSQEKPKIDTENLETVASATEEDKKRQPFEHPAEKALLRLLVHFPEKIEQAVAENKPNIVTTYLFELARTFSSFYNELSVLHAGTGELKKSRLKLVEAVGQVLKNGLNVLGIATFERM